MSTREYSCIGRAIVLDTGALLAGIHLSSPCKTYTTSLVLREVRDEESRAALERALESGKLEVLDPPPGVVESPTSRRLSEADVSILALALYFKRLGLEPLVFTDDYALQEELASRNVSFRPVRYKGSRAYRRATRGESSVYEA
ncbi:MAG: hypothetical protein QXS85_01690 [Acidilobaceae archaeon]